MRIKNPTSWISCAVLVFSLTACGGGDDNNSGSGGNTSNPGNGTTVPTTATSSLGSDETAAKSMVNLFVAADDQAVQSDSNFKQVNGLTSRVGLATGAFNPARAAKQVERAVSCTEYYPVGQSIGDAQVTGCTGQISVTSNFDEFQNNGNNQTLLPTGAFFTIAFEQVSIQTSNGGSLSLGGSMTMTVLDSTEQGAGGSGFIGSFKLSFSNLTSVDTSGEVFGPETGSITVIFDTDGSATYVIDGVRVSDFNVTETSDDDSYTINSGSIMTDYEGGHAEVSFQNWNVVDGIPQVGSTVTVTGSNGVATATVQSVEGTAITFEVVITVNGASQTHVVVAGISGNQVVVN